MGVDRKAPEKYTAAISQQVTNKPFYTTDTRKQRPGQPRLHVLATVLYSNETKRRLVLFCDRGFQLFVQNPGSLVYESTISYMDLLRVRVFEKNGIFVKISLKNSSTIVLLIEKSHIAYRIEEFLKSKIPGLEKDDNNKCVAECVRTTKIRNIAVKIEFGRLRALAIVSSMENFSGFQRKVFAEIGRCLLDSPQFDETRISLKDFSGFRFFALDDNKLYSVTGDKSLKAALLIASTDAGKKYAFFDIQIGSGSPNRVVFELAEDIVPRTCKNFLEICTRDKDSYKSTIFHRIIPKFMMQGGDFENANGTGGSSIYGRKFDDENFKLKHEKYCLSMANAGPNTNGSQFFITFQPCDWLDRKHVVFGKVIRGFEVCDAVEQCGTPNGTPKQKVTVVNAGELSESEARN